MARHDFSHSSKVSHKRDVGSLISSHTSLRKSYWGPLCVCACVWRGEGYGLGPSNRDTDIQVRIASFVHGCSQSRDLSGTTSPPPPFPTKTNPLAPLFASLPATSTTALSGWRRRLLLAFCLYAERLTMAAF